MWSRAHCSMFCSHEDRGALEGGAGNVQVDTTIHRQVLTAEGCFHQGWLVPACKGIHINTLTHPHTITLRSVKLMHQFMQVLLFSLERGSIQTDPLEGRKHDLSTSSRFSTPLGSYLSSASNSEVVCQTSSNVTPACAYESVCASKITTTSTLYLKALWHYISSHGTVFTRLHDVHVWDLGNIRTRNEMACSFDARLDLTD